MPNPGPAGFVLSSQAGVTDTAFCIGQPFVQGEVPAGTVPFSADAAQLQIDIKNRWPDGSVKFALVSGRASLAAGARQSVRFAVKAISDKVGSDLTESDLLASGFSADLSFRGGRVALRDLLGLASVRDAASGRWRGGRVRTWCVGPQMSSWLYAAPLGADAHLMAWFEVRYFGAGQVHLLPWVENGFLLTPACTGHVDTLVLNINGQQRFSQEVHLANHCRVVAQSGPGVGHWANSAPDLRATPDTLYWQQSRLLPAYYSNTPVSANLLATMASSYSPALYWQQAATPASRAAPGNYPPGMGTAGYHGSIGLIPEWDAAFLTSGGDARAAQAVLANALGSGRYAIHDREESTLRPMRFSINGTLGLGGGLRGISGYGSNSRNTTTPLVAGWTRGDGVTLGPEVWNSTHHPSIGFVAYLLTGQVYFLEASQFTATLNYLKQNNVAREDNKGILRTDVGANTTRGAAWALRSLAQAACITPDDDALQVEFNNSFEANIGYYHQLYVATPNNAFGVCRPYSNYSVGAVPANYSHSTWMEDFLTAAFGYALDLALNVSSQARARHREFFNWKAQSIVGRLGRAGAPDEYAYQRAAQYTLAVAPADNGDGWLSGKGPWYANWGQAFRATHGKANDGPTGQQPLVDAYYPDPSSYWGNLMPAIAYAVEHRAPGAMVAFARMTTAPNWNDFVALTASVPVWGIRPRR